MTFKNKQGQWGHYRAGQQG